jgi:heme-degrading monooxygenase HmoA
MTGFVGDPPKRVAVHVWDSIEKIQAWRNSPEFKELEKIGAKYAKFREYAVQGVPQQ